MHYNICEAKSAKALQEEVARLLAKGWRPTGGISVTTSPATGAWWYYQAMVYEREDLGEFGDRVGEFVSSDPEFA